MRKSYAGLFVVVMLLVVVCCIYGSGVSTVKKTKMANETQTEQTQQLVENDGEVVEIEDEEVPASDSVETASVSGSILFLMSALLLIIIVAIVVIVATVAASTSVIDKF